MTSCDFSKADVRGADFRRMSSASADTSPQFRGAIYDEDTAWPDGFDPKAAGAILSTAASASDDNGDSSSSRNKKPARDDDE